MNYLTNTRTRIVLAVAAAIGLWSAMGAAVCWPVLQLAYLAFYARKARLLGGPDLAGVLRGVAPAFALILIVTLMASLATASFAPLIGVGAAALVGLAAHGVIGWQVKQHAGFSHAS